MSDARQNILERIRKANQRIPHAGKLDIVKKRLQSHVRGPQPLWQENLVIRFITKAEQAAASIEHINQEGDIVQAVESYMNEQSLENRFVRSSTPILNNINWPDALQVETRAANSQDMLVVVEAYAAIAETGSIVMCSSENTPVTLNFLPDHYICVIRKNSIVNAMEDVWDLLRQDYSQLPRAINIITGPSRTADVEQIIQMGAHGPRRVHLLLLE